jgi:hypothetical protein
MTNVKLVLKRVKLAKSPIDFWTHTEIGQAVARRMAAVQAGIPDFLLNIVSRREFWDYAGLEKTEPGGSLGLGSPETRGMLSFPAAIKVYLCTVACDMRRSFDGLSMMAQHIIRCNPWCSATGAAAG